MKQRIMSDDTGVLEYRKQNFHTETQPAEVALEPGEITLRVTTNGYQFSTIGLLQGEIPKVIEALQKAIL